MTQAINGLQEMVEELTKEDVCLAFSGGVDSSLLLAMLCERAKKSGHRVYAVTFKTKLHPAADMEQAKAVAQAIGADHVILEIDEFQNPAIRNNPVDRCYLCKKHLFKKLTVYAREKGVVVVLDGTNADDLNVYRPGRKALSELGIKSPLAECGIGKAQVRDLAEQYGLSVAHTPAAPCLATRLPYNTPIDGAVLQRIEAGENFLKSLGFLEVRLRLHGEVARIEVPQKLFHDLLPQAGVIVEKLRELGFFYITLDLEGFRSGSMDQFLSLS